MFNPYIGSSAEHAAIWVHETRIPYGGISYPSYKYEWRGESNKAFISMHMLNLILPGDIGYAGVGSVIAPKPIEIKLGFAFWLGHLNLVITDIDYARAIIEVALADGRAYQSAYARHLYYALQWFWVRFIVTLQVWGLADIPSGTVPNRSHIRRKK